VYRKLYKICAFSIIAVAFGTAHIPPVERLSAQLIEQRLGPFQVGGIEAFGEPGINLGQDGARLVAATSLVAGHRQHHILNNSQLPAAPTTGVKKARRPNTQNINEHANIEPTKPRSSAAAT
jgi:hypothetical protein